MAAPKEIDVVRRAYQLWQQAGEPSNRDEDFYFQAKTELQDELQEELDNESQSNASDKI